MSEAGAVIVAFVIDEYLGFVFKPAKCGAVDDPVPITLKRRACGAFRFRMETAAAFRRIAGVGRYMMGGAIHRRRVYRRAYAHKWRGAQNLALDPLPDDTV